MMTDTDILTTIAKAKAYSERPTVMAYKQDDDTLPYVQLTAPSPIPGMILQTLAFALWQYYQKTPYTYEIVTNDQN